MVFGFGVAFVRIVDELGKVPVVLLRAHPHAAHVGRHGVADGVVGRELQGAVVPHEKGAGVAPEVPAKERQREGKERKRKEKEGEGKGKGREGEGSREGKGRKGKGEGKEREGKGREKGREKGRGRGKRGRGWKGGQ